MDVNGVNDGAQNQIPQVAPVNINAPVVFHTSHIRQFDTSRPMEWPRWVKLLNFNFTSMHITDPIMKRAHFFTVCGENLYNLACNISHPQEVDTVDFDVIITGLTNHFSPQVNKFAAYHKFYHCLQKQDQTVADFVAELRELAADCQFDNKLNDMLCGQVICGIRDENVRTRLLQRPDLTLKEAIDTASGTERALSQSRLISGNPATIHYTGSGPQKQEKNRDYGDPSKMQSASQNGMSDSKTIVCYRCAVAGHRVTECQMDPDSLICTQCEKKGHVAKICQANRSGYYFDYP